jgi:hypothetical protein
MIWKINHVVDMLSPVHDCAYRGCNQSIIIVGYASQRFLGPCNNLAAGSSYRVDALGPLPFDAAVDAQWTP